MLTIYADEALGRYGYIEKPWYQPDVRLRTFVDALADRGSGVDFRQAPPATDDDLALFHTLEYVRWVTARCAANRGSLDRAPELAQRRARILLSAIAAAADAPVDEAALVKALGEVGGTLAAWAPFLASDGLVEYDGEWVQITDAGRALLADPAAGVGGPTYARAHVERAARHVCGAVLDATRRLAAGELTTAFVPIAGFHHAHRDAARMYCLYNDPGIAIEAALDAVDGPIAYIDVDIHHGDGVYEAFADHPRVVVADLHEGAPDFVEAGLARRTAHTGRGAGEGTKRALAVGHGMTDDAFLEAFAELEAFVLAQRPAFVIFEAGVDGLADDPLSHQALTPAVFGEIARRVKALADTCAGGRLLVLGGGGYELTGLAKGWTAVIDGLSDAPHS